MTSSNSLWCFFRIFITLGSIFKCIWIEFIVFMVLHFTIQWIYHSHLSMDFQLTFQMIRNHCNANLPNIPVIIVLMVFTGQVAKRWWETYAMIPSIDSLTVRICAALPGNCEKKKIMRKTIIRYILAAFILAFRRICSPVKKRFPTMKSLVTAGFLMENEKRILTSIRDFSPDTDYTVPMIWAANTLNRVSSEDYLGTSAKNLVEEIAQNSNCLSRLLTHANASFPVLYIRIVKLIVYIYLAILLIGHQNIFTSPTTTGQVLNAFPVSATFYFITYVGCLKVAMALIYPFENGDHFEITSLIDRLTKVGFTIVDEVLDQDMPVFQDIWFEKNVPKIIKENECPPKLPPHPKPITLPNSDKFNRGKYFNRPLPPIPTESLNYLTSNDKITGINCEGGNSGIEPKIQHGHAATGDCATEEINTKAPANDSELGGSNDDYQSLVIHGEFDVTSRRNNSHNTKQLTIANEQFVVEI